jgi:hypothetical protein
MGSAAWATIEGLRAVVAQRPEYRIPITNDWRTIKDD